MSYSGCSESLLLTRKAGIGAGRREGSRGLGSRKLRKSCAHVIKVCNCNLKKRKRVFCQETGYWGSPKTAHGDQESTEVEMIFKQISQVVVIEAKSIVLGGLTLLNRSEDIVICAKGEEVP